MASKLLEVRASNMPRKRQAIDPHHLNNILARSEYYKYGRHAL